MTRHDFKDEERELEQLFSALDDISASDDLKARTLGAIFAELDEEKAPAAAPKLAVIDGGAPKATSSRKHRPSLPPRVAAIAVALVLATGGIAYAVPVSYVTMTSGETTIDLGVNVFGRTVNATAGDEEGATLLEELELCGKGYEDAMETVADGLAERKPDGEQLDVHVHGGFGRQRDSMDEAAGRVMERRNEPESVSADVPAAVDEPVSGSMDEHPVDQGSTMQGDPGAGPAMGDMQQMGGGGMQESAPEGDQPGAPVGEPMR